MNQHPPADDPFYLLAIHILDRVLMRQRLLDLRSRTATQRVRKPSSERPTRPLSRKTKTPWRQRRAAARWTAEEIAAAQREAEAVGQRIGWLDADEKSH